MGRNKLRIAAILLALVAVACGGSEEPPEESPTRVTGLIADVEPPEGTTPTSFTVEEEDGDSYAIEIDPELDYGFDLHHVYEHFENDDPVDVTVEERDGALVATAIEDV